MKKLIITLLILAVSLSFTSMSLARWNDSGFKSSPLFKHALNNAIDRLEGKINNESEGDKPTSKAGCSDPKAPETSDHICETYENTCEGNYTCVNWSTCQGQGTCMSTCANTYCGNTCDGETCSGETCTNTCPGDPGLCKIYQFRGVDYWVWPPYYGSNWYALRTYYGVTPEYDAIVNRVKWSDSNWYGLGELDNYTTGEYSGSKIRTTTTNHYSIDAGGWMWDLVELAYYQAYGRTDVASAAQPYDAWNEVDVYVNVLSPYR